MPIRRLLHKWRVRLARGVLDPLEYPEEYRDFDAVIIISSSGGILFSRPDRSAPLKPTLCQAGKPSKIAYNMLSNLSMSPNMFGWDSAHALLVISDNTAILDMFSTSVAYVALIVARGNTCMFREVKNVNYN